jgi:DNA-binding SARP family transcriptional activator
MSRLAPYLLGPPRLERNGLPLELDHKNVAPLTNLAVMGDAHIRESLITLLWPEVEPSRARTNLGRSDRLQRRLARADEAEGRRFVDALLDSEPKRGGRRCL